jgi:hypothetical protein
MGWALGQLLHILPAVYAVLLLMLCINFASFFGSMHAYIGRYLILQFQVGIDLRVLFSRVFTVYGLCALSQKSDKVTERA